METTYTIILPDGQRTEHTIDLPKEPGYDRLAKIVYPVLGKGRDLERVNVFHDGKYTDMFVDDSGLLDELPRNEVATAIYRANVLKHEPGASAEGLPHIAGPAVLFSRRVWY